MHILDQQIDNFRIFEIVAALSDTNLGLVDGKLNLTDNVFGIKTDEVRGLKVKAAQTGVNGVHSIAFGTPVKGDLYHITINVNLLDLGQPSPYRYSVVAPSTSKDDLSDAFYDAITGDPRYSEAPFKIFKDGTGAASTDVVAIVEDPKGDLIAGEIVVHEIVESSGGTVTLNHVLAALYDDGGDQAGVAHVDAIGQPAQLTRIKEHGGNASTPSVAPSVNFIGTVDSGTVYTVVSIEYFNDRDVSNPVSQAGKPLTRDIVYIDEAATGFAYIKSIFEHFASIVTGTEGPEVALIAAATAPTNGAIPVGAKAAKATPGTTAHDVSLSGDYPIGAEVAVTNGHATNTLDVDPAADETINGGAVGVVYNIAGDKTATLKKVTSIGWVVVSEVQAP